MKKKCKSIKGLLSGFMIILSLMIGQPVLAQQINITGRVTNSLDKEALVGVTIMEKGTTNGVLSDALGNYSINVNNTNSTLVFSFVGMEPQEVVVGGQKVIDITMKESVNVLDEVVVTGYQTQKRADLTGSVSVANIAETKYVPTSNILKAVQGKVAGLYITGDGSPNQATTVNVRGVNTLGNTNPLYIIDGAPTTDPKLFQSLDPSTIESFQVLKDASAASIYGSRASNGVIIVTTKSGKGGFRVDFRSSLTVQNHKRRYDLCNTDDYGRVLWRAGVNDGIDPNNNPFYIYTWHKEGDVPILDAMETKEFINNDPLYITSDTDWPSEVFKTGIITSNSLTISGGTDRSSTMVDLSYYRNKGMVISTDFKQLSLRLNNSINFLQKKLKIGENIQLLGSSELPSPKDNAANIYNTCNYIPPVLPVYKTDGTFAGPWGAGFSDRANPVQMAEVCKYNRNNNSRVFGNVFAEITPIKNLVFKSSLGLEAGLYKQKVISPLWQSGFVTGGDVNKLDLIDALTLNWFWSNTLNYQLVKGKSRAMFLIGTEAISNSSTNNSVHKEGFAINDDPNFYYVSAGTGNVSAQGTGTENKLVSYFAKGDYIFNDKYIVSGTVRYDGSSRFGENNRFGLFPAGSLGWVISNENFMKSIGFLSNLKLRGGYGVVGNQEIGDYSTFQLWQPSYQGISPNWFTQLFGLYQGGTAYDLNGADKGTLPSGFRMTQSANPDLKWESTSEMNLGVDFSLFKQKVTGSFDYFTRETTDILTTPPYLAAMGEGATMTVNGATMKNKGWEFVLGYNNKSGDFTYSITGNFSHFDDKITYLPETVIANYPGNSEKTIIGHSRTSQFGYIYDGLFQNQAEVDAHATQPGKGIGRIRFKDLNNDGLINVLDQDWLGTLNPKLIYGITGEASYKNFSLSIFLRGVSGALVQDRAKLEFGLLGYVNGSNKYRSLLSAWTPENPNSNIPMVSYNNINQEERASDYTLVNGSYFKLQSAQLSYTLPSSVLKTLRLSSARVYLLGENLILLFDKNGPKAFSGADPEVPYTNLTGYPKPVSFTFGLDIQF
jgi:TonB-dependent starch-binding outer membrane protein SusC